MYISIDNVSQFRNHFAAMGRADQFSYEALNLLYEFLEENIEGYELDVIALCCDYAEDTFQGVAASYDIDLSEATDGICTASSYGLEKEKQAIADAVIEYLEQHTQVVGVTDAGTILYTQF
jgi:hypothetical protein